jgi:hypothetical protein
MDSNILKFDLSRRNKKDPLFGDTKELNTELEQLRALLDEVEEELEELEEQKK